MSDEHNVTHATFNLERTYPVSPNEVFAAFAKLDHKKQWFSGPNHSMHEMNFKVGGKETAKGKMPNGAESHYDATYLDIIENQRIIYAYEMAFGGKRISATLTSIELEPVEGGTKLKFTEQSAFLDGFDGPKYWDSGTSTLLEKLGKFLNG